MKTVKQFMMEQLIVFGKLYQLPNVPSPEYLEALQVALRSYGWKLGDFRKVLSQLTQDDSYAETARFGKYPTIHDFLRVKKAMDSTPFYTALAAYLSGDWWEKENVKKLATPEQNNALVLAGGLNILFQRATGEKSTPVYKLVELVAKNELEAPLEKIDTTNRIGGPAAMYQITDLTKGNKE